MIEINVAIVGVYHKNCHVTVTVETMFIVTFIFLTTMCAQGDNYSFH